ncbi:hypothetical protein [Streptomyces sp. NPDC058457]|uniref:hypothetical protein n=1 Tax=Streptomyces sp. NPDC058457 TaxID=3346507 RepID=UPI0036590296
MTKIWRQLVSPPGSAAVRAGGPASRCGPDGGGRISVITDGLAVCEELVQDENVELMLLGGMELTAYARVLRSWTPRPPKCRPDSAAARTASEEAGVFVMQVSPAGA